MSSPATERLRSRVEPPIASLAEALARVESRLEQQLRSREPLLTDISTYLVESGGKRVRPTVTLLVFRACGGRDLDDIVDVAAALELIHSASLLHDDIIDSSDTRRGKPSAFRTFGLANTLVTGDFVFSRAFQLCARFEECLINWAAEACVSLTEGEVMQGRYRRNVAVTKAHYLEIISRKTASIFRQGARTAAYLAGADETLVEAMADCGFHVGMAFQIVDDLLDVAGVPGEVGKPVGLDLLDGNPSLPVVLALPREPAVARVFQMTDPGADDVAAALGCLRACGVLDEVRALASEYGQKARQCLEMLPPSADRTQLRALVDELLERTR